MIAELLGVPAAMFVTDLSADDLKRMASARPRSPSPRGPGRRSIRFLCDETSTPQAIHDEGLARRCAHRATYIADGSRGSRRLGRPVQPGYIDVERL